MKQLLRRSAMVVATALTCASLLPATGANAAPPLTPCSNIDGGGSPTEIPIFLPNGLGTITVHLNTQQDSWVWYDGPGTPFDTLVGVDLQTVSLSEDTAVCVYAAIVPINMFVVINVTQLTAKVCDFTTNTCTP